MRIIAGVVLGILLGIFLFGPVRDYWENLLNSRVTGVEARVDNIEKFLKAAVEEGNKNAATPSAKTATR